MDTGAENGVSEEDKNFVSVKEAPKKLEHERRFLVKYLPEGYDQHPHIDLLSGYTNNEQTERYRMEKEVASDGKEVVCYIKTLKVHRDDISSVTQEDPDEPISKEEFDREWQRVTTAVRKTRYKIPYTTGDDQYKLDLDVLHERSYVEDGNWKRESLEGKNFVEVEDATLEKVLDFTPPDWFGEEVTHNKAYSNKVISRNGWPASQSVVQAA